MEGRRNYVRWVLPELRQAATQLREGMTAAEQALWEALRDKKLGGLRFRAQHPVGQFILDFYCPACNWPWNLTALRMRAEPKKTPREPRIFTPTVTACCGSKTKKR